MKIVLFDHHKQPFPIQGYGGIERIVQWLFQELNKLDCECYLICNKDSDLEPKDKLIKITNEDIDKIRFGEIKFKDILPKRTNIIHTHTSYPGFQKFNFKQCRARWLATCHGHTELVGAPYQSFVSHSQMKHYLEAGDEWCKVPIKKMWVVHNGVPIEDYVFKDKKKDYYLWFAKICDIKGTHTAVEIAQKTQKPLIIAGNILDYRYFCDKVAKFCDNRLIKYVGTVHGEERQELLSDAYAYLFPIYWEETFGITVIEAMLSGTPVITYDRASMPELVPDNVGIRCKDFDEMLDVVMNDKIKSIQPHIVRSWAEQFSIQNMASRYLEVYKERLSYDN